MTECEIILEILGEHDVGKALNDTSGDVMLLSEERYVRPIEELLANRGLARKVTVRPWKSVHHASLEPTEIGAWIVVSPCNEEYITRSLAKRTGLPILGLYSDFYPQAVCFAWNRPLPRGSDVIRQGYVILSTPRSGSTLLSELMALNGMGRPKEHIREPLLHSLIEPFAKRRFNRFLELAVPRATHNGVFGTKIVSHFAQGVANQGDVASVVNLVRRCGDFRLILLLRQNKVEQGVSAFRARQSKTFHIRSGADLQKYNEDAVHYDFDAIASRYDWMVGSEDRLIEAVARAIHGISGMQIPVHVVIYEHLEADMQTETSKILEFLGRNNDKVRTNVRIQKLANEQSRQLSERFVADFTARNGVPPVTEYDSGAKMRAVGLMN